MMIDDIKRGLRAEIKKRENEQYATFQCNVRQMCKECAKILYGFDAEEEHPSIKKIDPYYQLWYRRQKALPIFEAYLHSELKRFELELKLEASTHAD